jgi:polyhydroxyalkanoate synthase
LALQLGLTAASLAGRASGERGRERGVGAERGAAFLDGLKAYWRHPHAPSPERGTEVWRAGGSRLIDLGPPGDLPPVLVVPSLVNRARILDITPERSLLAYLADGGLRPFLLDWGEPGPEERAYRLADYALGRGGAALRRVRRLTGRRPALLGYCMGGLLALALAAARRREVAGLALLATPWDFHADPASPGLAGLLAPATLSVGTLGTAPVELLQSFFALIDPGGVAEKFAAFAALPPEHPRARTFVAVEDWLADGVPLAGPVALEALWSVVRGEPAGPGPLGGRRPARAAGTAPAADVPGDPAPRPDRAAGLGRGAGGAAARGGGGPAFGRPRRDDRGHAGAGGAPRAARRLAAAKCCEAGQPIEPDVADLISPDNAAGARRRASPTHRRPRRSVPPAKGG